MTTRVTATAPALELLERLRARHGDLIVHLSGGCCDGSSPMCLRAADLPAGPHDVQLGAPAGVNPATVVVRGFAASALVRGAGGIVDLLVMGSRGQGPLQHAIAGSTSRAVTVEISCPVLITPRGAGVRCALR